VPHDIKKETDVKKVEGVKAHPENGASKGKAPSKESAVHGKQDNISSATTTQKPSQPQQPSVFWGAMTAIEKNFVKLIASIQGLFTSAASTSSTTAATTHATTPAAAKKENHVNKDTHTKVVAVAQGLSIKEPTQKKEAAHPK
jgi:hypothetical protein